MSRPKRVNWWVRWLPGIRRWRVYRGRQLFYVASFTSRTRAVLYAIAGIARTTAELHILRKDGRIYDKRTYPRASDPRSSKG